MPVWQAQVALRTLHYSLTTETASASVRVEHGTVQISGIGPAWRDFVDLVTSKNFSTVGNVITNSFKLVTHHQVTRQHAASPLLVIILWVRYIGHNCLKNADLESLECKTSIALCILRLQAIRSEVRCDMSLQKGG